MKFIPSPGQEQTLEARVLGEDSKVLTFIKIAALNGRELSPLGKKRLLNLPQEFEIWTIESIFVAPETRGKGIGTNLVLEAATFLGPKVVLTAQENVRLGKTSLSARYLWRKLEKLQTPEYETGSFWIKRSEGVWSIEHD